MEHRGESDVDNKSKNRQEFSKILGDSNSISQNSRFVLKFAKLYPGDKRYVEIRETIKNCLNPAGYFFNV